MSRSINGNRKCSPWLQHLPWRSHASTDHAPNTSPTAPTIHGLHTPTAPAPDATALGLGVTVTTDTLGAAAVPVAPPRVLNDVAVALPRLTLGVGTDAPDAVIVADGSAVLAPDDEPGPCAASAAGESAAKPIAGPGEARKTEYTFFYGACVIASALVIRGIDESLGEGANIGEEGRCRARRRR